MKYAAALVPSIGIFGFASSAQSMPIAAPSESPASDSSTLSVRPRLAFKSHGTVCA
jgi:hypothetical protein